MKNILIKTVLLVSVFVLGWGCQSSSSTNQLDAIREKLDKGKYREAVSLADESLKHNPSDHQVLNMRGVAYFLLGENSKALSSFTNAIALDSSNYKYFYNRANTKRKLRNHAGAVEDYSSAVALDSSQYEAYLNRALEQSALGKVSEAIPDFDKAEVLSKGSDKLVFLHRGRMKMLQENFEEAGSDFQKAIALDKDYGEAYYYLALSKAGVSGEADDEICTLLRKANELGVEKSQTAIVEYCQ